MTACKECKHWGDDDFPSWEADAAGFRLCTAVRARWVIADEADTNIDRFENGDAWLAARREALVKARAYVEDGSDYIANLMTGPDFGCVLFSPKSAP